MDSVRAVCTDPQALAGVFTCARDEVPNAFETRAFAALVAEGYHSHFPFTAPRKQNLLKGFDIQQNTPL